MSLETTAIEVPEHVEIKPGSAFFSVSCGRCDDWVVLYHYMLRADPDALRREVERHELCREDA